LFGVGAGSLIGQRFLTRMRNPLFVLGLLQMISAAASIAMILIVPSVVTSLAARPSGFGSQLTGYFIGIGVGTIVPTLCMGASFPLLVRILGPRPDQTGDIVGRALAWNTLGGVIGAPAGSFLLLDRLGLAPGLFIVAALTALVGASLIAFDAKGRRVVWIPAAVLGIPLLMGLLISPVHLPDDLLAMHFPDGAGMRILESRDSVHGTVAITDEQTGIRRVWINSTWVANERSHLAFGYAPWLLHPGEVRSALGICCGTGRTFGALMNAGIPDLDLVDINAAVISLSSKWLARSNHGVLTDPRAHIVIDDGRNFVRYGTKKYDLITLEPLQMYQKGVAYFYTEEFYRQARSRMAPGGVICQWVPLYLMDQMQFQSIVKTFVRAFPNSLLWGRRGGTMVLLGYNSDARDPDFRVNEIYARMAQPELRTDLAQEGMVGRYDPLAYTLVDGDGLRDLSAAGEVYTDDRPALEFTAARTIGHYTPDDNLALVRRHLVPIGALFHLTDPRLAGKLEDLRMLTLEISGTGADRASLLKRMEDARRSIYPDSLPGQPQRIPSGSSSD